MRADEREKRESDTGRPSRTLGRRPGAWPADPLPSAVGGRYGYLVDKSLFTEAVRCYLATRIGISVFFVYVLT